MSFGNGGGRPRWSRSCGATRQPHVHYVRPSSDDRVLSISGSVVSGSVAPGATDIAVRVSGRLQEHREVGQAFTVQTSLKGGTMGSRYVPVTLEAGVPLLLTDVALFSVDQPTVRLLDGFFLPERDEQRVAYRWMAPRGRVDVRLPSGRGELRIRGRLPFEHYPDRVTLSTTWNGQPLATVDIDRAELDVQLQLESAEPDMWNTLELHLSHSFVPSRTEGTDDSRVLAMRIYGLDLVARQPAAIRP
ncbi:MAG: hypothetical protein AB7I50_02645 [Vicinamibacterales bacterium]